MKLPKTITLTTFIDHAPAPGGCKCGWSGDDLMDHVEAELRREAQAKGVKLHDVPEDGA